MKPQRLRRGSVLVIVMVTVVFAVAALAAFLDKASNDLLVAAHVKTANRLREDAHSALETTLGVLADFMAADNNELRSPAEGWGTDPLAWAGWTPADSNHTVEVAFEDESGRLPLMHVGKNEMLQMFESTGWGMQQDDAQHLVDVLEGWMHNNYTPVIAPMSDYEQSATPYDAPVRPMRSYEELRAIDYAKDIFFDPNGVPTPLYWQFVSDFSLFNYPKPNINSANADVQAGLGQFSPAQSQNITDYLAGKGDYVNPAMPGPQWFTSDADLRKVAGGQGNMNSFQTTIAALRVTVTVHEGGSTFKLSAVVAPARGGATTVMTTATDAKKNTSNSQNGEANNAPATTSGPKTTATNAQASAATATNVNIQYPFTILEIQENEQIITPPPPPPAPTS